MYKTVLIASMAAVMAACSSAPVPEAPPELQAGVISSEYHIGVTDQLQVNVWRNPDLSVAVPVRPDGKISVPLVGDVVAAGRTSEELAEDITRQIASYIRNPEVTVIVVSPNSAAYLQRVRVTGAVNAPQSLVYQQGMTVLDVVLQAGGVTDFGIGNSAKLFRQTADGLKIYPVKIDDILTKGKLETNYKLAPSDILTVPERIF